MDNLFKCEDCDSYSLQWLGCVKGVCEYQGVVYAQGKDKDWYMYDITEGCEYYEEIS